MANQSCCKANRSCLIYLGFLFNSAPPVALPANSAALTWNLAQSIFLKFVAHFGATLGCRRQCFSLLCYYSSNADRQWSALTSFNRFLIDKYNGDRSWTHLYLESSLMSWSNVFLHSNLRKPHSGPLRKRVPKAPSVHVTWTFPTMRDLLGSLIAFFGTFRSKKFSSWSAFGAHMFKPQCRAQTEWAEWLHTLERSECIILPEIQHGWPLRKGGWQFRQLGTRCSCHGIRWDAPPRYSRHLDCLFSYGLAIASIETLCSIAAAMSLDHLFPPPPPPLDIALSICFLDQSGYSYPQRHDP